MNNKILNIVILLVIAYSSCIREEIPNYENERRKTPLKTSPGCITYQEKEYELDSSAIYYSGKIKDSIYNINIILYSDSIKLNASMPFPEGEGDICWFELCTSKEETIPRGVYYFTEEINNYVLKNFEFEAGLLACDNTSDLYLKASAPSSIEVKTKDDSLFCNFSIRTLNGNIAKGYYKGVIVKKYY